MRTTTNTAHHPRVSAAALALSITLVGGCGLGEQVSFDGNPLSATTSDNADPIYQKLIADLEKILTTTGGLPPFEEPSRGTTFCAQDPDALTYFYRTKTSEPIAEEAWPQTLAEITALLEDQDFDRSIALKDEPGHHVVVIGRADGVDVRIGTQNASTISVKTACHPKPPDETDEP